MGDQNSSHTHYSSTVGGRSSQINNRDNNGSTDHNRYSLTVGGQSVPTMQPTRQNSFTSNHSPYEQLNNTDYLHHLQERRPNNNQTYPPGVINPCFTGMFIWELRRGHPCNHYMIPREADIRTGLVFRGHRVFIYTPILNNDISSYIKVILNKSSSLKSSGQTNKKKPS